MTSGPDHELTDAWDTLMMDRALRAGQDIQPSRRVELNVAGYVALTLAG